MFDISKLYFRYGTMYSGKSGELIGIATNYGVQGKKVLVFSPRVDTRPVAEQGFVESRCGTRIPCVRFSADDNLREALEREVFSPASGFDRSPPRCILIDEAQFLTPQQVLQAVEIVDSLHIPVIAFGLKNDFRNELFEGSRMLLLYADSIEEIKTVCWHCDRKATMVVRLDAAGQALTEGSQVVIDTDAVTYLPVCRRCHMKLTGRAE